MARHAFYALHYAEDRTRAAGILASRALIANTEASQAEWAKLQRSGDFAIQRWVENQLKGRSCLVVLIGTHTSSRPWVQYEIKRAKQLKLALLGVRIHRLHDAHGQASEPGENPFAHPNAGLAEDAQSVPVYDPPDADNATVYRYIVDNIAQWADDAVDQQA